MYIAIDIIIVAVMAACIIGAVKNGFIVTLFKMLSAIVALVIAFVFCGQLGAFFYDSFAYSMTYDYISEFIGDVVANPSAIIDADAVISGLPEGVRSAVDLLGIDVADMIDGAVGVPSEIAELLSTEIATVISNVLAFVALFFGSLIVLFVVRLILDGISKLPVLNGANKFLGLLIGAVEALVIGMVIANVAATLCSAYGAINESFEFVKVAENTVIAKFLIMICPW